jgi:hypothetical protein
MSLNISKPNNGKCSKIFAKLSFHLKAKVYMMINYLICKVGVAINISSFTQYGPCGYKWLYIR